MAVLATGLLVLAVGQGWLGPDVGRGDGFCEAARAGPVKQPANAFSNAGFVLAGLLVGWHAGRHDRLGRVLPGHRGLATSYACVVVLLGPASAAMHATQSAWGGHLDLLSMYLVAAFSAAYALTRWSGRALFGPLFAGFVVGCELVGSSGGRVPVVDHAGNVAFAALLATAVVTEVLLWRRAGRDGGVRTDLRWGAGALAAILVAFAIWSATKRAWCDPHALLQGHAAWHLLCAVAAYLMFRLWASEDAPVPEAQTAGVSPSVSAVSRSTSAASSGSAASDRP